MAGGKVHTLDRAELDAEARHLVYGEPEFESVEEAKEYLDVRRKAERDQYRQERVAELEQEERRYEVSAEGRSLRAQAKASEIKDVRAKLDATADGRIHSAAGIVLGKRPDERLNDADFKAFRNAANAAVAESELADKLGKLQRREQRKAKDLKVIAEPSPYEKGSPHSWVADSLTQRDPDLRSFFGMRASGSDMSEAAVDERLQKHGEDINHAMLKRSKYGKRIEKILRESRRQEDAVLHEQSYKKDLWAYRKAGLAEARAFTTGGGATAAASSSASPFVPPAFLIDSVWAPFRSPYRAFADQCNMDTPLPEWGMEVYLTIVTTGTTVTTQTEGSGVSEGDPVTNFASSPIGLKAGQITVTQQFIDRAGPGISGDQVLFQQIRQQLDAQVDVYAITQALASAVPVLNNGAFAVTSASGVGGFLKDLKTAKNSLHDTAGVRLRGTHAFAFGDFVDYVTAYADAQGRPLFSPSLDTNRLPIQSKGDPLAEGYSGYVVNGLALFADDNVPASGADAQIIVCRPDTILQLEGAPIPYLYPPSVAGSLEGILGLRQYVATIARFPSGVATISGSAYTATTFA